MNKKLDELNQVVKLSSCLKIGFIIGVLLGLIEGLVLAIKIIKDNESSFLSVVSAFKFLNISIIIHSSLLIFINLILYISINFILRRLKNKLRFLYKAYFYILLNLTIIFYILIGFWLNKHFGYPFWSKNFIVGNLLIFIILSLFSSAITWFLYKFQIQDTLRNILDKKKIKIAFFAWIMLFLIAIMVPFPSVKSERENGDINVLMIIIDALRADHLGCYGYSKNISPAIDGLANEGALFSNTIAQWPTSTPSHASIFTSTYPHTHNCFPNGKALDTNLITIAEILKENGYSTAAFIKNPLISKHNSFDQGFYSYFSGQNFNLQNMTPKFILNNMKLPKIIGKLYNRNRITASSLDWLQRNRQEKFFLVLQYFEPHTPYVPHHNFCLPEEDIKAVKNLKQRDDIVEDQEIQRKISLYDGEIAYTDFQVKKIIDKLNQLEILENTLIIITADHGENLNQHQPFFAHKNLYDSSIKIPLIMRLKNKIKPVKIAEVVESIDIVPTILDILNIAAIKQFEGKSLYPYMRGIEPDAMFEGFSEELMPDIRKVCIRTQDWKFIISFEKKSAQEELYNINRDPLEKHIVRDNVEISSILRERIFQWISQSKQAEKYLLKFEQLPQKKIGQETLRYLRSLGYIE